MLWLGACSFEAETLTALDGDEQAADLAAAGPVVLPPAIAASSVYRCGDNSLLYADFLTDKTVRVREDGAGGSVLLASQNGAPPYTAPGYSLDGNGSKVLFSSPARKEQPCVSKARHN